MMTEPDDGIAMAQDLRQGWIQKADPHDVEHLQSDGFFLWPEQGP